MSTNQRICREINRRQAKVQDLQTEIQRTEHFIGERKCYLTSLKESLIQEYDEIQRQTELKSAVDTKFVSISLLKCFI